jgi:hydroxymethylpyrimidine kinase/phosphomethylpyrimidine kinase
MLSTSGSQLLPEAAVSTLIKELLPLTTILTPNLPEALLLLKIAGLSFEYPENVDDILTKDRVASKDDAERQVVLNVLYGDGEVTLMETEYLKSRNTHGTGCSLASAIACNLASGLFMIPAVNKANIYVAAGIKLSKDLGKGIGPINHFHSTYMLPFPP